MGRADTLWSNPHYVVCTLNESQRSMPRFYNVGVLIINVYKCVINVIMLVSYGTRE
jgi:hypothetical protein